MPWNIKNLLLPSFCLRMEHLFKDLALEIHLKMSVQRENTNIFWIRLEPFLISSSYLEIFWGEAALTTFYTINRIPSFVIGNVFPFDRLHNRPLNYQMLKVFDNACFVLFQPMSTQN